MDNRWTTGQITKKHNASQWLLLMHTNKMLFVCILLLAYKHSLSNPFTIIFCELNNSWAMLHDMGRNTASALTHQLT